MKLNEALETWFKRAGIDFDLSEIPDVELPDGSDEKVKGLMNLQLAKQNKQVRDAYFQLFAKGTEKKLSEIIESNEIDIQFDTTQSIENKIESVFTALAEKSKSGTKPEKENQLNQRIAELTKQLNESKQNHEQTIKSIHEEYSQKATNNFIEMQLGKIKYKDGLNQNDMIFLAKTKLQKQLDTLNAQVKIDGENVILVQKDNPEAFVHDSTNGLKITFDDLVKASTSDLIQVEQTLQIAPQKNIPTFTPNIDSPNISSNAISKAVEKLKQV